MCAGTTAFSRSATRRGSERAAILAAVICAAAGCGPRVPDPAEQFRAAIERVRAGELAGAYRISIPESYDKDLNDLLDRLRSLVGPEELKLVAALAARVGEELAKALEPMAGDEPGLGEVARRARELPRILGLEEYETFRNIRAADLLARLDAGIFREAAKVVCAPLDRTSVRLVERERNWAKVRFVSRDAEGRETYEDRDLVLLEGKWVLNDWYAVWQQHMESWRSSLDALAKKREDNPAWLRETLGSSDRVLDYLSKTLEPTLRHFRRADSGAAEARKER